MRKKPKRPTNESLSGIRVLVGRARHQAGALSSELRRRGAVVIEIPFIEIRKPRSFRPLDTARKNLGSYDWLILTSVNGVEAMWERWQKFGLRDASKARVVTKTMPEEGHDFSRAASPPHSNSALAAEGSLLRTAAIGPATKKAIEQRGAKVDVVPKEYIAESVVRSLKNKVKGKRVLLVRAKIARDVIPRELRKAGAEVDVIEAYETIAPKSSGEGLRRLLANGTRRPHAITFTSSSTVKNFVELLGLRSARNALAKPTGRRGVHTASIGPVTSATLRGFGLPGGIDARE